jgi:acetoin utilization protein AcuB
LSTKRIVFEEDKGNDIGIELRRKAMFVKDRMTHPVITIHPDMPLQDALRLMQTENVRRFPVVDGKGKLVGIVSERDLLHASPSDATSLSVWEVNYLLSKIKVDSIMTRDVTTISEDTPLEEAARIMADSKIGALPVVHDEGVVGIITETDLFKVFLELFGARESGVRITALLSNVPGTLAKLAKAVFEVDGNIVALGTMLGTSSENVEVTFKVQGVAKDVLKETIEKVVEELLDIRETRQV